MSKIEIVLKSNFCLDSSKALNIPKVGQANLIPLLIAVRRAPRKKEPNPSKIARVNKGKTLVTTVL